MAHRVVWSPAALEDVEAIASYIARDSPHYAAAVVRRLVTASRQLKLFSESGRPVPELEGDSFRELVLSPYRLIYRVEASLVTIAAVVHEKQSFETGVARVRNRPA